MGHHSASAVTEGPPMSFLDRMRGVSRKDKPAAEVAPPAAITEVVEGEKEVAVEAAPKPKRANPMVSFLDSIKSRRVD